jgi:nitroreductase
MTQLNLNADQLLTTTRAVRKRLNFDKPVPLDVIRACIEIALQAPTGGNTQGWQFVVVADAAKRLAITELYRKAWALYKKAPGSVFDLAEREPASDRREQHRRVATSADYLVDNLEQVPVLVIPCVPGRVDRFAGAMASVGLASVYGSILPATWSYMLAARERGLGTCWTTAHLMHEEEAAEILDIPYEKFTQVAMIPTAFYTGENFKVALRKPVDDVMHIDSW